MNEEVQKKAMDMLETLAEKLNTTVQHLWEVLLRQADVTVYKYAVGIVFVLALLAVGAFVCRWCFRREIALRELWEAREARKENSRYRHKPDWAFPVVLSIPTVVVPASVILMLVLGALTPLLNPEYWALREILSLF